MNENPTNAKEQYELGRSYWRGSNGLSKDPKTGFYWFKKAAEQGNVDALLELGSIYKNATENVVSKDVDTAARYCAEAHARLTDAAENGDAEAQYRLAYLYLGFTPGIKGDNYAGARWLEKAAEQGYAPAMRELGAYYENGTGVPQNKEKALFWFNKAVEHGDEKAKTSLDRVSGKGCFVATCVYGSYDCPQVWTLRRYRDRRLSMSWFGRRFIQVYYAVSPTVVRLFGDKKWFKELCKPVIDSIVCRLQRTGI